jgi:hypothetical protein
MRTRGIDESFCVEMEVDGAPWTSAPTHQRSTVNLVLSLRAEYASRFHQAIQLVQHISYPEICRKVSTFVHLRRPARKTFRVESEFVIVRFSEVMGITNPNENAASWVGGV